MDALLNSSSNGVNGSNGNGSLNGGNALEATGRHQSQPQGFGAGGPGGGRATGDESTIPQLIEVKKYPNRRLYDTSRSCHLTHAGVLAVLAEGKSVQVTDSRSGADITNAVLLQILIERDPAKIAAVPSALIHRAMRSDAAALRAAAEAALTQWNQSSGGTSAAPAAAPTLRPVSPTPHPTGTAQRAHFPVNGNGHANGTSNGHTATEPSRAATTSIVDNGRPKAKAKRVDG